MIEFLDGLILQLYLWILQVKFLVDGVGSSLCVCFKLDSAAAC